MCEEHIECQQCDDKNIEECVKCLFFNEVCAYSGCWNLPTKNISYFDNMAKINVCNAHEV